MKIWINKACDIFVTTSKAFQYTTNFKEVSLSISPSTSALLGQILTEYHLVASLLQDQLLVDSEINNVIG
jgi:hypothetical protein